jgi:hypothetical protein
MKKAIHNITISYWLKISFISLIIVIHLLSHEVFAGQFYRCTDAGGIETYTDQLLHANCKPLSMYGNTQISKGATVSTSPLLSELFQSSDNEVSNPDIINVVKTPIIGTGIDRFYTLLRKLQNGELTQVTIFHVGDSHVRSEAFSRKVAAVLQLQFGSLGGTFCFPANKKALASKTPVTSHKTPPPNKSNRNIPPSQAYLNWSRNILGGREPLGASTSTDSQRAHESVVSGDKPERASLTEPDTCNPITSLPGSLNGTGLSYYSYGNSGKTFAWYLTQPGFIQHLQWYRPDLVIVTLGTNDAFKKLSHIAALKDVDVFVRIIRSVLPNCRSL